MYVGKPLNQEAKVNFKIFGVTNWRPNNYNTHIVIYLKKYRQSGIAIRSVNKI